MENLWGGGIDNRTTIILSERELFLIKWSLDMMKYNLESIILKADIDKIRNRLVTTPVNIDTDKN